jgi:hypothetical protein
MPVYYEYGDTVSKRAVDLTFQAIFTLTDLRVLLRKTAPSHELDGEERAEAERLLLNLERQAASLRGEMLR